MTPSKTQNQTQEPREERYTRKGKRRKRYTKMIRYVQARNVTGKEKPETRIAKGKRVHSMDKGRER
jgi:hypothetical protein